MPNKIFYFLGNVPSHILHALSIYKELGGEFIVLSEKAKAYCEFKKVNVKMLDNYPEGYMFLDYDKIQNTINYLNNLEGVIFFFECFNLIKEIKNLKKIMLFHGSGLKPSWFSSWQRFSMINDCDYMTTLSPYRAKIMQINGLDSKKFIPIGLTRWDEIIKNSGNTKNQQIVYEKLGIKNKKIITYMPTWYGKLTSVFFTGKEIIKNISNDYILLFRPHPDTPCYLIEEYNLLIKKKKNVLYVPENRFKDISLMDIFLVSDLFIGDASSATIDCILTNKPIIFALDNKDAFNLTYNPCKLIKGILKKIIYFGKNPFDLAERAYEPIKEILEKSNKIDITNVKKINEKIENDLNRGIDVEAWDIVKRRMFYCLEGDSKNKLIQFVKKLLN